MPTVTRLSNVAGIDLASAPEYGAKRYNRVGLASLAPNRALVRLEAGACDDDTIIAFVVEAKAGVVAIDAPLSLPAGRCCADESCKCARFGRVRGIDRACFALGLRPFPALIPSMRGLTLRGIALKARLECLGVTVIEVFPGAVQDVLHIPRKQASLRRLLSGLRRLGLGGLDGLRPDGDELDALTAAYMAHLFREGRYWAMAVPDETPLIFPLVAPPSMSSRRKRRTKREKVSRNCHCGCGRSTFSNFAPGHDARVYSLLRKELRGQSVRIPQELLDNAQLLRNMRAKAVSLYGPRVPL
jgi:predicted nuclease with RNAse H fold